MYFASLKRLQVSAGRASVFCFGLPFLHFDSRDAHRALTTVRGIVPLRRTFFVARASRAYA